MATVDPKVVIDDLIKKTIGNEKFEIQIKNPHSLVNRIVSAAKKADAIKQMTLQQNEIITALARQFHILQKLVGRDRSDSFAREDYRRRGEESARTAEAQEKQIEKTREQNAKAQENFKELQEKHDVAKKALEAVQRNIQDIAGEYSLEQANLAAKHEVALIALPAQVLAARRAQFQEEINGRFEQLAEQKAQLTIELESVVKDLIAQIHQANAAYINQAGVEFAQRHNVNVAAAQELLADISSIAEQKFSEQEYRDARVAAGSPKVFGRPEMVLLKQKELIQEFCEKHNISYSEQLANEIIDQRQQQLDNPGIAAVQEKAEALKEEIKNVNEEENGADINNLFESAEFDYQAGDPANRVDCRAEERQLKATQAGERQELDTKYENKLKAEEQKLPELHKQVSDIGAELTKQKNALSNTSATAAVSSVTETEEAQVQASKSNYKTPTLKPSGTPN